MYYPAGQINHDFFAKYFIYQYFQGLYRHFDEFFEAQIKMDREEDDLDVKSSNRTNCSRRSTDIDKDPFYLCVKWPSAIIDTSVNIIT